MLIESKLYGLKRKLLVKLSLKLKKDEIRNVKKNSVTEKKTRNYTALAVKVPFKSSQHRGKVMKRSMPLLLPELAKNYLKKRKNT